MVYSDNTVAILPEEHVLKEGNLRLSIPKNKLEEVVNALESSGFKETSLEFYKGEKYSLSSKIYNIWELHTRIYQDGFIDSHFEVSRDYLEHLQYPAIPSIYEVFYFYRTAYDRLRIFDSVTKKLIKEVKSNYFVTLGMPRSLTPWKPIVIGGILGSVFIMALLSSLDKGE